MFGHDRVTFGSVERTTTQQMPAHRRLSRVTRFRISAVGTMAAMALAVVFLGPAALFADAAAPSTIAPYVHSARADLASNINDHDPRPFNLRFVQALCRADGGAVLIFEQRTFPYLDVEYAYAMTAPWPPTGWSGGAHLSQPFDSEIAAFLGDSTVPCR